MMQSKERGGRPELVSISSTQFPDLQTLTHKLNEVVNTYNAPGTLLTILAKLNVLYRVIM